MPRIVPTVLTMRDIRKLCGTASAAACAQSCLSSALRPAMDFSLAGQELRFFLDNGQALTYRFDRQQLAWSSGGAFHEEYAECFSAGREGLYFVHHMKTDAVPYSAATLVIDLPHASVTYVDMTLGTVKSNRDVQRTVRFGTIGGAAACAHALTDELTGVVIDWMFAEDAIIHQMYENWSCCVFVSPPPAAMLEWSGFFLTFNPTKYVRVQDQLYLISFCAPGSTGAEADMLMDLNTMTCVGSFFGIDYQDALRSYTFGGRGAYAEPAFIGRYTVESF